VAVISPLVPILLTTGVLGGLYATRGPVSRLVSGHRYLLKIPRAYFQGASDDQIRASFAAGAAQAQTQIGSPALRSLDPDGVWVVGTWLKEPRDIPAEEQSRSEQVGYRGPYALAFGNY
jgi:hypothetical protein